MWLPVVQLYAGVLTTACEAHHVILAVVHFVFQLADRLTGQSHVVDDVQRPVNLASSK